MNLNKTLLASTLALSLCVTARPALAVDPACHGKVFNPVTDPNWNDFFPVTIMGLTMGGGGGSSSNNSGSGSASGGGASSGGTSSGGSSSGGSSGSGSSGSGSSVQQGIEGSIANATGQTGDPPTMHEPAVCTCPDAFGLPYIGIGITYWMPAYIAEVEREPGCLATLGGLSILPSYRMEASEQSRGQGSDQGDQSSRMQVNWYHYPIFKVLEMFTSYFCHSSSDRFALAYMTPIDPTWQNDLWGAIFNPEGILFANPLGQAACAVDAVASSFYYPIDALFWCAGTWGSIYPLSGTAPDDNSAQSSNGLILSKFIARESRIGALLGTVTDYNKCSPHYTPVWIKTQFRVDPIGPVTTHGAPIYVGKSEFLWGLLPPANYPTHESSSYLIWNGTQCCMKIVGVDTIAEYFTGQWLSSLSVVQKIAKVLNVAPKVVAVTAVKAAVTAASLYAEGQAPAPAPIPYKPASQRPAVTLPVTPVVPAAASVHRAPLIFNAPAGGND